MATYMNQHSNRNQRRSLHQDSQTTVLASCYSAQPSTTMAHGFHYCTTLGAGNCPEPLPPPNPPMPLPEHSGIPEVPSGSKPTILSPPLEIPASNPERSRPANHNWPEDKGEATHTIPEECERLFCGTLSTIFLGERSLARQEPLGMGAVQNIQPDHIGQGHDRIQKWIEVWDYSNDAIYRGFVVEVNGERTLFVFFEDRASDHGFKSGLIALFELAGLATFECSQIVACVSRSDHANEMELIRNLGWCGFNLTTLEPWTSGGRGPFLSTKWLFLAAEV